MAFTFPKPSPPALPPLRYAQGTSYASDLSDMVGTPADAIGMRRVGGYFNTLFNGFTIKLTNSKLQLLNYGSLQDAAVAAKLGIAPDPLTFDDGVTPFPERWYFAVEFYGAVKPGLQDPGIFVPAGSAPLVP